MTAEIALLNKSAVVLAADSAVTVGSGDRAKIFNTVNKVFDIGNGNPIGLMVFNRLDFMGLPIEVLAKEFRNKNPSEKFDRLSDCKDKFVEFLKNEVKCEKDDEEYNTLSIVVDEIEEISERFTRTLREDVGKQGRVLKSRFNGILQKVIKDEADKRKKYGAISGFGNVRLSNDLENESIDILKEYLRFVDLTQASKTTFIRYLNLCLKTDHLSNSKTGLVFAGFGSLDICPSLCHIETDGKVMGKMKVKEVKQVDIGRHGPEAEILGFAQDDMVQSFVNGVDPVFRNYSIVLLRQAIEKSAKDILSPILNNANNLRRMIRGLKSDFDKLADDYKVKSDDFVKENFTEDVKLMVRSMPKEELANLAEALIDITSLKRKVTRERETVGGDVDVAVISRSEGLVWVKRKHYFPAELNTRFFERQKKLRGQK